MSGSLSANPFAALFAKANTAQPVVSPPKGRVSSTPQNTHEEVSQINDRPAESTVKNDDKAACKTTTATDTSSVMSSNSVKEQLTLNYYLERVLLVTLDSSDGAVVGVASQRPPHCVYLDGVHEMLQQDWMDIDVLGQVIFERLLMQDPSKHVVKSSALNFASTPAPAVMESRVMHYLCQCYVRTVSSARLGSLVVANDSTIAKCQEVIVSNATTCLLQPDICGGQSPSEQLADILINIYLDGEEGDVLQRMLGKVVTALYESDAAPGGGGTSSAVASAFLPALNRLWKECSKACVGQLPTAAASAAMAAGVDSLVFFTTQPCLGELLVDFSTPRTGAAGGQYEVSLLGVLLSSSSMPSRHSGTPLQLYSDVAQLTQPEINVREAGIWQGLLHLTDKAYSLFQALLRLSPSVKHRLLNWIGGCLHANAGRVKLAAMLHEADQAGSQDCSDGFMLNLSAVLLRLCKPFSSPPRNPKLLRIQPEYCLYEYATDDERRTRNHHSSGLPAQTSLVPRDDLERARVDGTLTEPAEYGGVTELFFMTQSALHLGFHTAVERFFKANNDLGRLQGMYQQARQAASLHGASSQEASLKMYFENEMKKFLCMKAALTQPQFLEACLRFHMASAAYLVQLVASAGASGCSAQSPPSRAAAFTSLQLPLQGTDSSSRTLLCCIPEFVITNMADVLTLVRRYKDPLMQVLGEDIGHIMDVVLVFMGAKERLKNPHLRAKLAIVLEDLLPVDVAATGYGNTVVGGFYREQLFKSHVNIEFLAETLISVFVSIEMTGEGVRFEEKFNYRRPMYKVMEFMWTIELHRTAIKGLAEQAESRMEDVDPPLFLRFINLLVNDAIYLLDEALSYMRQIREKELQQERSLQEGRSTAAEAPSSEERRGAAEVQRSRQEEEGMVQHMSMLARFHNMLGADTIHTLAAITSECQSIFCHTVMVDRVAAMLNYFLLHLTGPNMKDFKVKNFEKYDFQPKLVVSDICQIYLNLGTSPAFCTAVSADGRSYSPKLFPQAEKVLGKIGKPFEMIDGFNKLATVIQAAASRQMEEDACLADAPDEFLDPIMGTLMRDPVILPSSRVTVDRSTIARHILSDQTDPFNRSPLTMDMVEPDAEIQQKLEAWLRGKLDNRGQVSKQQPSM